MRSTPEIEEELQLHRVPPSGKDVPARVLIADDDPSVLSALETILEAEGGYQLVLVENGKTAFERLQEQSFDAALIDLSFEDMHGLEILLQAKKQGVETEIILITGRGSIGTAVEAMRRGAYDYLTKPVESRELLRILQHAVEKYRLQRSNRAMQQRLATLSSYEGLIGKSAAMQKVYELIEAAAPADISVLITGESGTGKELVARALHNQSKRQNGPFLAINCAALPATILETELFGHVKGAFTGAGRDKAGYFEQADGGTLFLDELADMPFDLQAKLLRVLETHSFRRVGGRKEITVDMRILAATNRNPEEAVASGRLRDDLYFRLAVMEINTPPLRERTEDIPLLAQDFLRRFSASSGKNITRIAEKTMHILMAHAWPGNVRELRNAIERAVVLCRGTEILPEHLPPRLARQQAAASPAPDGGEALHIPIGTPVAQAEKHLILRTLASCKNNKTRAAEILGVSLKTLHNKLGRYRAEKSI